MIRARTAPYLCAALLLSGILVGESGCSNKQLASSSGDESTRKAGDTPPEAIQPEQIASIEPSSPPPATVSSPAPPTDAGLPAIQEARSNDSLSSTTPAQTAPPVAAPTLSEPATVMAPDNTGIGDIYFDFDQYSIRADAQPVLDRNGQWMRKEPGKSLLIEGHCDERGTLAYNLVLGEKRAKAAKRYLETIGIPAARLQTTSYGEVKPVCKEHNEGCWKYNRRAHFVVQ